MSHLALPHADRVEQAITASRAALLAHPIYAAVDDLPHLRRFMADHVFAVWDFMTLLKRLQRDLTCVDVIWRPPGDPVLARFVNEVVLVEESDQLDDGPISHLELYRRAMDDVGADASSIDAFLTALGQGAQPEPALRDAGAPAYVVAFVEDTLRVAHHGDVAEVLAAFLFGREDVIPDMFQRFLSRWQGPEARWFACYLERHVEVDGDEHGPLARQALEHLLAAADAGAVDRASAAASEAIASRVRLWDGARAALSAT